MLFAKCFGGYHARAMFTPTMFARGADVFIHMYMLCIKRYFIWRRCLLCICMFVHGADVFIHSCFHGGAGGLRGAAAKVMDLDRLGRINNTNKHIDMFVYIYIYIYMYTCMYVYIYIYIYKKGMQS